MDVLKALQKILLLLFVLGCSKTAYLLDQGHGQFKIQWDGRPYEQVLKDPGVSLLAKKKIKRIQEFKIYFFEYFNLKPTGIYSRVTFLKEEAVSHLVITSPHDDVKALEECFVWVGCFPYLGHFSKKKAESWARKKEKAGFHTFTRPVYAYSTLTYFEDRILSSFFKYKDEELAELIFHEIFHTIFWVKDEVALNENLASFFAKKMVQQFFKKGLKSAKVAPKVGDEGMGLLVAKLAKRLKRRYREGGIPEQILTRFLEREFTPEIVTFCQKRGYSKKKCWPLKRKWNNATFAAYLTYNEKQSKVEDLFERKKYNLRVFLAFIKRQYKAYQKDNKGEVFSKYLLP